MKLVVVGGVAGGASAAARVRRLDAYAEVVMFERGEHVSFSNCCLPYHLSGTVASSDALVLMSPEKFKKQHNIDARTNSEVIDIKRVFPIVEHPAKLFPLRPRLKTGFKSMTFGFSIIRLLDKRP